MTNDYDDERPTANGTSVTNGRTPAEANHTNAASAASATTTTDGARPEEHHRSWFDVVDGLPLYVKYTIMLRFHCVHVYELTLITFNLFALADEMAASRSPEGEWIEHREGVMLLNVFYKTTREGWF